jgi:hypothetical protein
MELQHSLAPQRLAVAHRRWTKRLHRAARSWSAVTESKTLARKRRPKVQMRFRIAVGAPS